MKIIAGKFKGRNFYMPQDIRPTQNVARKAVFDILGQDMDGLEFLDLFAGSGAVGFEALSRGAKKIVFVEHEPKCAEVIRENLGILKIPLTYGREASCEVLESDAFATIKHFARKGRRFDIVFIDPPYGRELAKKALKLLDAYDILQPKCFVILQHDQRELLPDSFGRFLILSNRRYGNTSLSIYKPQSL